MLIFAASGNSGSSTAEYPASYPFVVSVAAVGEDEKYASFSNYNDQVELVGPGVSIKSTLPGDSYGILSGTSMAAPHGKCISYISMALPFPHRYPNVLLFCVSKLLVRQH